MDNNYEAVYSQHNQQILPNQELVTGLSYLLMDLQEEGNSDDNIVQALSPFDSPKIPQIAIDDYLYRILKQAQCSQECLIMALIFIDRLSQQYGRIILKPINMHRLFVISVMVSAKFYDDRFFQNVYYAKVAGISHEEFNSLEREFLFLLDFKLLIDPDVFFTYRERIVQIYCQEQN